MTVLPRLEASTGPLTAGRVPEYEAGTGILMVVPENVYVAVET